MVWYFHLLKNFTQFVLIHTVKGFGIVNKAEIDIVLELSCFFHDPADVGILISVVENAVIKKKKKKKGNRICHGAVSSVQGRIM